MDEIVVRAIAKWPNVPAVYGWLSLDLRGNWAIKGERIRNPLIAEFIARNYAHDERGRWFFQNGPQRVFVRLAYTPLVYRTRSGAGLAFVAHTGQRTEQVRQAWIDDQGRMLLETELGVGVLHDQDLPRCFAHLTGPKVTPLARCSHRCSCWMRRPPQPHACGPGWTPSGAAPLSAIRAEAVPDRFRFDPDPRPAPGEPEC